MLILFFRKMLVYLSFIGLHEYIKMYQINQRQYYEYVSLFFRLIVSCIILIFEKLSYHDNIVFLAKLFKFSVHVFLFTYALVCTIIVTKFNLLSIRRMSIILYARNNY